MADTDNRHASSNKVQSRADAYALVGHEIRSEIIRVFGTSDNTLVLPFGEIRSRITMNVDPGQLHYHLEQLVGHYIDRTENGYRFRPEGIRLFLTVKGRPFERQQEPVWLDPEFNCHTCQNPVKARLCKDYVRIWCDECDNVYGCDFLTTPHGAFNDGSGTFSFSQYSRYIIKKSMSIATGVCPNCAHTLQAEFRADRVLSDDQKVVIDHWCDLCYANWAVGVGQALLGDAELRAFCADHDIDLLSSPYWELEFAATDEYVTVRSTDPLEVALRVTFNGDTLELVVDEDVTVVERNRWDTTFDENTTWLDNIQDDTRIVNESQDAEVVLPDNEECVESIRRYRWPNGVVCPRCDGSETIREGKTNKGAKRYRCHNCERTFNDLTETVFAQHRLTLPEMFYILREKDLTETARIARQINCSPQSVQEFVREVEGAVGG